jgi:hypothetical protein
MSKKEEKRIWKKVKELRKKGLLPLATEEDRDEPTALANSQYRLNETMMISRGREWDWMYKKIKVMSEEELQNVPQMISEKMAAQQQLIGVLMNQVVDLTMMSKIELGDDVIAEIKRLQEIIHQNEDE